MEHGPLTGFTVGITGDRRADEQAELFHRRGALVVHGPMIETRSLTDDPELRQACQALVDDRPEIVVATTGVGFRSWMEAADGIGLGEPLRRALGAAEIVARSPKAAGALVTAGLSCDWKAEGETNQDVIDHLTSRDLTGVRIAVQRDGSSEATVASTLAEAGADVVDVPVYRWILPTDPTPAHRLLDALVDGQLDAITITSSPALSNLLRLADNRPDGPDIRRVLVDDLTVACVGPVCAAHSRAVGITRIVQPQRFRLGSMVKVLTDALAATRWRLDVGGTELRVQGALAVIDGVSVTLPRREQQLIDRLAEAGGAVVSKGDLGRDLWGPDADLHVVEVTIGRLRSHLGPAAAAVVTVPRRGYRLAGPPTRPA